MPDALDLLTGDVRMRTRKVCRPRVTAKQRAFLRLGTRFSAFVGGRGSGKTTAGTLKSLEYAGRARCTGVIVSPTYGNLEDINMPAFLAAAEPGGVIASFNRSRHTMHMSNGSVVHFRSADHADFMRGLSVSWAWLDEAAQLDEYTWRVILPALREGGHAGDIWITTTPRGKDWIWDRFAPKVGETDEQRAHREARFGLIQASTQDNAFLSATIIDDLTRDYGVGWFAQQELAGEFVDPEGSLFRREWLPIVDHAPDGLRIVRGWDLACTTKSTSDYTVGVRLGVDAEQTYYVLHVVRGRWEWPDAEKIVAQTCAADGAGSQHYVEKVGFQTAAVQGLLRRPELAPYAIRPREPGRDKLSNALPFASRAQAGKVRLVRGPWNAAYIDELCAFSGDGKGHDDQVDGTSIAYHALQASTVRLRI